MPICSAKKARPTDPVVMAEVETVKRNNKGAAAKKKAAVRRKTEKLKVKARNDRLKPPKVTKKKASVRR